jgi:anti-sigma B factor antagonist
MNEVLHERRATIVELGDRYDSLDDSSLREFGELLLREAEQADPPCLLLDLSQTGYIGSRFVEVLVRVWRRLKQRGGVLALCGVQPFCLEVLKVTRLDQIWSVYPSRREAMDALETSAESQAEGRR